MIHEYARNTEFGVGRGFIAASSPFCFGDEAVIADCSTFIRLGGLCDHRSDVAVRCAATSCTDGEVRLVNGVTENEGRVEVCQSNIWGTVCGVGWDGSEAEVVCRLLGYNQGMS